MKRNTFAKICAVLVSVVLLCAVLSPTAFALGAFGSFSDILGGDFGDILSEFLGGLGGGGGNGISLSDLFTNPNLLEGLQERLQSANINVSNTELIQAITAVLSDPDSLSALMGEDGQLDFGSLLSSNTFFNLIADYLLAQEASTATIPSTTAAPTTEESTTQAEESSLTIVEPSESFTVIVPSTYVYQGADAYSTLPSQTTTEPVYSYVQPAQQYTEPLTNAFTPTYEEDNTVKTATSNAAKMAIGAFVVLASAAAIVAVAIMLKKTKA